LPRLSAAAFAGVLVAAVALPAMAFDTSQLDQGGSLSLDDITPLIDQSPALKREVTAAATKAGKKPERIICAGMRFSNRWKELGGARVAPYTCKFADDRYLKIRATVRLTGDSGKVFEKPTREAMRNASHISETKPVWSWAKDDPDW